ncbi:MAG TPA: methylamine utilization protein MauJ [Pseudolabrys sp.]|nr:methylamine utilization protein MauJ [Pseudolabrys sp.]
MAVMKWNATGKFMCATSVARATISDLSDLRGAMYAKNLERILALLCEKSDVSYSPAQEYDERFNALRGYGQLPRGRERREQELSNKEIAAAVFGLVATRPSWAGHVAIILEGLRPVGGAGASFFEAATLSEAVGVLLTNETARKSFIRLSVTVAETGVNSNGGAELVYEHDGKKRIAYFVPAMASSLLQPGCEVVYDPDRDRLPASAMRGMSFNQQFFQDLAVECKWARLIPVAPEGDGSEYDEEEAKQSLWRKLGVIPGSRFLNMAADNHITWPGEATLVKFDGYHFVLMPRTKDNVQSVHMDLMANRLDDGSATTVIRRFLSVMAWCDDNFATLGFGWSGNPVPVPVAKPELAFRTTPHYIFDRKMPSTPAARRALALYREALNAEHGALISYAVLNYYKIIELTQRDRGATKNWFRDNFAYARRLVHLKRSLDDFDKLRGAIEPHEYIYKSCRIAVAHAGKDSESDPDDAKELLRLHAAADIMQALARHCIEVEFKISDCRFDGT